MTQRRACMRASALVTFVVLFSGCAMTHVPRPMFRPISPEQVDALRVGAAMAEVRALLGEPHRSFGMEMGTETARPWQGFVLEYDTGHDARFEYAGAPVTGRLVFAVVEGDTLLNHWDLDASTVEDERR